MIIAFFIITLFWLEKNTNLVEKVSGTRFLVLCVCFVDRYLSFCLFSFGHWVVYSSSIYGFELPL